MWEFGNLSVSICISLSAGEKRAHLLLKQPFNSSLWSAEYCQTSILSLWLESCYSFPKIFHSPHYSFSSRWQLPIEKSHLCGLIPNAIYSFDPVYSSQHTPSFLPDSFLPDHRKVLLTLVSFSFHQQEPPSSMTCSQVLNHPYRKAQWHWLHKDLLSWLLLLWTGPLLRRLVTVFLTSFSYCHIVFSFTAGRLPIIVIFFMWPHSSFIVSHTTMC